ncbi:hypothetical protein WN55_02562 [Dufourea novaeangliae]|uniref:Uncharacterized protein n=1 Tax=Dufourea novaeangliae TaxID=178035 RepID=A0A154PHQ2_DUFNO|nr:hypothetical protein WN55_02562 [Dufourea novaeangliae]
MLFYMFDIFLHLESHPVIFYHRSETSRIKAQRIENPSNNPALITQQALSNQTTRVCCKEYLTQRSVKRRRPEPNVFPINRVCRPPVSSTYDEPESSWGPI